MVAEKIFNLKDKVFIVAGGSGQLGFSLSEVLSKMGAKVAIVDLDIENANEKIKLSSEKNIFTFYGDITDEKNIREVYLSIYNKFGKLNGLVNSFHFKGNSRKLDTSENSFSAIEEYPISTWDKVHDVNLKGTFISCKLAIPFLKKLPNSSIVNISSTYGIVSPNKNIYSDSNLSSPVSYASSKSGVINLSRYLATYLAEYKIRVNVLSPGGIYNNQDPDFIKKYENLTPLKRMSNPEDYHAAMIFLLSNGSSYMTGSNLVIDGGWTAW